MRHGDDSFGVPSALHALESTAAYIGALRVAADPELALLAGRLHHHRYLQSCLR